MRSYDGLTGAWVEPLNGTEHPPQPPGVVMHPNGPDPRQRNRPGMSFPDADCIAAAWILLVPKTKALAVPSFALGSREADLTTTLRVSSEPSAKIDGGFLEHLSGDLLPPREPGDVLGGRPVWKRQ
jgi:hypothetical protein